MNEQFSAFLDNEATRDEADSVVNALLRDEALRDNWTRQHWIRTALRTSAGETPVTLDAGFSSRVMQAIHAESGRPADDVQTQVSSDTASNTASNTIMAAAAPLEARPRPAHRRRRWRSMAGLAAAASATGFVLLVSNPMQQEQDMTAGAPTRIASAGAGTATPVAANTALGGDRVEAATAQADTTQGPADHWAVSDPALANQLNGYLVEHNGLARGYGLAATTPGFVRVATYGQDATQ